MLTWSQKQTVQISTVLIAVSFILMKWVGQEAITVGLMLMTTAVAGASIFKKAIAAVRYRIIGIDTLVTVAVIGALAIGEYWEAAAVTFLFTLGDYLESRTLEKTRASIRSLMSLAPDTARVRRHDEELILSPEEVVPGDTAIVKPGEKIPVDGIVAEGSAYVNQAAITGEPLPIHRKAGEKVFSGTIIESGYLLVLAERVGDDTTFARIMHLVEEAQDNKAKTQKFLEAFARYYTPAIMLLAAVLLIVTRDIHLALTVLVISCPGALVISTPISIVAGIGNGAKHGILFKGGEVLEKLGAVRAIAFDKTGTLTEGKPRVTKVAAYGIDELTLLRYTAIGEAYSEHPLAAAIVAEAQRRNGEPIQGVAGQVRIITGQGLSFVYQGQAYYVGNRKLFAHKGWDLREHEAYLQSEEQQGQTVVIIGTEAGILGMISIADTVRPGAAKLVAGLRAQGISRMTMLTGDNPQTAQVIAAATGLDECYSELLPEDKVHILKRLAHRHGPVAMIGDGVNDAPALASADLGIAIGGVGKDIAMETADVVLMGGDITKLTHAVGLSRAAARNIKQNISFSLLVVGILLTGALIQAVNMSLGMLVHEGSVLVVILNAMRLSRYKGKTNQRET